MLGGNIVMVPGHEVRDFTVLRLDTHETEKGREVVNGYTTVGTLRATLASAKPEEIERWRIINHPITHKIIMQYKPAFDILPGDIFERAGRRFYNQFIPNNVGDLGHWTIFYCDERTDVK